MKYALLIYDVPGNYDDLPEREREAVFGEYFAISEDRVSSAAHSSSRSRRRPLSASRTRRR